MGKDVIKQSILDGVGEIGEKVRTAALKQRELDHKRKLVGSLGHRSKALIDGIFNGSITATKHFRDSTPLSAREGGITLATNKKLAETAQKFSKDNNFAPLAFDLTKAKSDRVAFLMNYYCSEINKILGLSNDSMLKGIEGKGENIALYNPNDSALKGQFTTFIKGYFETVISNRTEPLTEDQRQAITDYYSFLEKVDYATSPTTPANEFSSDLKAVKYYLSPKTDFGKGVPKWLNFLLSFRAGQEISSSEIKYNDDGMELQPHQLGDNKEEWTFDIVRQERSKRKYFNSLVALRLVQMLGRPPKLLTEVEHSILTTLKNKTYHAQLSNRSSEIRVSLDQLPSLLDLNENNLHQQYAMRPIVTLSKDTVFTVDGKNYLINELPFMDLYSDEVKTVTVKAGNRDRTIHLEIPVDTAVQMRNYINEDNDYFNVAVDHIGYGGGEKYNSRATADFYTKLTVSHTRTMGTYTGVSKNGRFAKYASPESYLDKENRAFYKAAEDLHLEKVKERREQHERDPHRLSFNIVDVGALCVNPENKNERKRIEQNILQYAKNNNLQKVVFLNSLATGSDTEAKIAGLNIVTVDIGENPENLNELVITKVAEKRMFIKGQYITPLMEQQQGLSNKEIMENAYYSAEDVENVIGHAFNLIRTEDGRVMNDPHLNIGLISSDTTRTLKHLANTLYESEYDNGVWDQDLDKGIVHYLMSENVINADLEVVDKNNRENYKWNKNRLKELDPSQKDRDGVVDLFLPIKETAKMKYYNDIVNSSNYVEKTVAELKNVYLQAQKGGYETAVDFHTAILCGIGGAVLLQASKNKEGQSNVVRISKDGKSVEAGYFDADGKYTRKFSIDKKDALERYKEHLQLWGKNELAKEVEIISENGGDLFAQPVHKAVNNYAEILQKALTGDLNRFLISEYNIQDTKGKSATLLLETIKKEFSTNYQEVIDEYNSLKETSLIQLLAKQVIDGHNEGMGAFLNKDEKSIEDLRIHLAKNGQTYTRNQLKLASLIVEHSLTNYIAENKSPFFTSRFKNRQYAYSHISFNSIRADDKTSTILRYIKRELSNPQSEMYTKVELPQTVEERQDHKNFIIILMDKAKSNGVLEKFLTDYNFAKNLTGNPSNDEINKLCEKEPSFLPSEYRALIQILRQVKKDTNIDFDIDMSNFSIKKEVLKLNNANNLANTQEDLLHVIDNDLAKIRKEQNIDTVIKGKAVLSQDKSGEKIFYLTPSLVQNLRKDLHNKSCHEGFYFKPNRGVNIKASTIIKKLDEFRILRRNFEAHKPQHRNTDLSTEYYRLENELQALGRFAIPRTSNSVENGERKNIDHNRLPLKSSLA